MRLQFGLRWAALAAQSYWLAIRTVAPSLRQPGPTTVLKRSSTSVRLHRRTAIRHKPIKPNFLRRRCSSILRWLTVGCSYVPRESRTSPATFLTKSENWFWPLKWRHWRTCSVSPSSVQHGNPNRHITSSVPKTEPFSPNYSAFSHSAWARKSLSWLRAMFRCCRNPRACTKLSGMRLPPSSNGPDRCISRPHPSRSTAGASSVRRASPNRLPG